MPSLLLNYAINVPTTVSVELLLTVATRSLTSPPFTSAEIFIDEPFVPTIAYSVIAILSDVSSVSNTSAISVCVLYAHFTRNLAER